MSTTPALEVGLFVPGEALPVAIAVIGNRPTFRLDLDSTDEGVSLYLPNEPASAVAYLDHLAVAIATLRADIVAFSRATAGKPAEPQR
ncbi:hypothetical protein [Catenulispora rubra]|uniref:hypothetical protein n=1 Tax=Catenulispora rubra TaxID=280293 RepID=UPI001892116E|nr:hypothetical protein [Catenulispora rubra]